MQEIIIRVIAGIFLLLILIYVPLYLWAVIRNAKSDARGGTDWEWEDDGGFGE